MHDIQEPVNMYDPYTYYPNAYSPVAYDELHEVFEEADPEDFIDLEDLYNLYNS